jgi:hypothetical protein
VEPADSEDVHVPGLRCSLAELRLFRQPIAFDDSDLVEVLSQRSGGQQSCHAAADHYRVPAFHKSYGSPPTSRMTPPV